MHLIYEIANNHNGDVKRALKIIDNIPGSDKLEQSIKLQFRDLETFIHPNADKKLKYVRRFLDTALTQNEFKIICDRIKQREFNLVITPFDEISVKRAYDMGIDYFKVASCSAMEFTLHEEIAKYDKPVIVSTAGLNYSDIDKIVSFYSHRGIDLSLLHCVAEYPCFEPNLNVIDKLKKRYPHNRIGYSGHENKHYRSDVDRIAIAKGAEILERHVGIDNLNDYSLDNEETIKFTLEAIDSLLICGTEEKGINIKEIETLNSLSRKVYKDGFIGIGCNDELCLLKDYNVKENSITVIREIVHFFKGMINEAGIEIGNIYDAEISHHYGIERFNGYGAFIISLINREYCKKLICMKPYQEHPEHYHKSKEESFHVMSGSMVLNMAGNAHYLNAGDIITVPRFCPHSFITGDGVIFEEVSTTHINGDSYYTDEDISSLDPMERKTKVEKL